MEHWDADDARRRHMARFGRRDTAPELALRRELHRRGRRFFVDRQVSKQCRVRPDLVFPRARVAVFVDGCFWHYCEEHAHLPKANAELWRRKLLANRRRDAQNEAILVSEGWRVLRFWEHENPSPAADEIEGVLVHRSAVVHQQQPRFHAPRAAPAASRPESERGVPRLGNEWQNGEMMD
ncbi:very short patch repair endonuclease [Curtobacterium sp. B8]|uniref:very short patch repair endonuclease n=1 Tax=Curtobacterium sp. B8 TaxID=95611 RepID=UPI000A037E87|nr:very short patch repair endonuclease [Curtobacterium sp. B8]